MVNKLKVFNKKKVNPDRFLLILCGFNNLKLPHHDLIEHICHIVVLTLSSGEVALFNAEQSTTYCTSGTGTCRNASLATDGNWYTNSYTGSVTEPKWWQVSMTLSNTLVYQIVLNAWTHYSEEITVSLYSGETLAGQCTSHTGSGGSTQTLSCDEVTADRVRLAVSGTSTRSAYLAVSEITVTGASTNTIGI